MKDDKRYGQLERKPDEILRDMPVKRYERGAGGRFAPRAASSDGDRPSRPYGDRPSGDRPSRPYGDRPSGDRPSRPYGDRPSGDRPSRPYGDRPSGDRPSRPFGDRPSGDRPSRPFGDRPSGDRPSRPFGDRPSGDRPSRPFGDRPSGDRPSRPFGDRPSGDRPSRPFGDRPSGDRPSRPYGDRPSGDRPSRPYGDRPSGDRPSRPYGDRPSGERPSRPYGDRPSGDRPSRPYGDRPSGDRPSRPYGDRPSGDRPSRPYGDRPSGDRPSRPFGDRPSGDRPSRPYGDRPSGDRPSRPYGDRPSGDRPTGDRPDRPARSLGARPTRTFSDRPRTEGDEPRRPARPFGERPARPETRSSGVESEAFDLDPFDVMDGTAAEVAEQEQAFAPDGADVGATGTAAPKFSIITEKESLTASGKVRKSRAKPKAATESSETSEDEMEAVEATSSAPSSETTEADVEEALNMPGDRLEGRNSVMEALKAGRTLNKMWIQKGQHDPVMQRILSKAISVGVVIQELDKRSMDRMAITHGHQGVLAQVAAHEYVEVDGILAIAADKGEPPLVLVLDELKESYNLGSILRIADAAGVHGVIIPERRSVSLDAAVSKASAGAVEHVAVARVTNIVQTLEKLKEKGFWIAGTDTDGKTPYNEADFKGPLAIVVGSEGEGLGHSVREHCDFLVGIPMAGQVNSLNAAVATGIVVFEAARQRRAAASAKR